MVMQAIIAQIRQHLFNGLNDMMNSSVTFIGTFSGSTPKTKRPVSTGRFCFGEIKDGQI